MGNFKSPYQESNIYTRWRFQIDKGYNTSLAKTVHHKMLKFVKNWSDTPSISSLVRDQYGIDFQI